MMHLPSWAADTLTAIAVTGFVYGWTFLATVDWCHPTTHTRTPSGGSVIHQPWLAALLLAALMFLPAAAVTVGPAAERVVLAARTRARAQGVR